MCRLHSSLALLVPCLAGSSVAHAHPSSGIVVDREGRVFIGDMARGVLMIDSGGKVTVVNKEGGHFLALDGDGSFSRMDFEKSDHWPRWFKRRTPADVKPALLTDGGSPLAVHDGHLYYVSNDETMVPGGLQIARLSPDGKLATVSSNLKETAEKLGGIKGLAFGPDDVLYASCPGAILKVKRDGSFSILIHPVPVKDCDKDPSRHTPEAQEPNLRGLDIDSSGTVYAAATGCRCVLKISPDAQVQMILKAERPWSPTGVALHGADVYVLEYTNPDSETHENWIPRVRKIAGNGKVTTLATFSEKEGK